MKILPIYHPSSGYLDIEYDEEAQQTFRHFFADGRWRREQEAIEATLGILAPDMAIRHQSGWAVLSRLGQEPSCHLRLAANDATNGFIAVLATVLHGLDQKRSVVGYGSALMLAARIAPVPISRVQLPPAVEIFDRASTPEGAWQTFELLRTWRPKGRPHIFLIHLYHLWYALRQVRNAGPELVALLEILGATTSLFRLAMHRLALMEVGSNEEEGTGEEARP